MKKETLEEDYLNQLIEEANKEFTLDRKLAKVVAIKYANWHQEQDKNKYSEEDMINFAFDTYNYISKLMGVPFNLISENKSNVNDNFIKYKKNHEK